MPLHTICKRVSTDVSHLIPGQSKLGYEMSRCASFAGVATCNTNYVITINSRVLLGFDAAVTSLSSLAQMRSSSGSAVSPTPTFDSEDNARRYIGSTSVHGSGSRRCGFPECQKTAKRGGFCISHGGGKKCSVEGCTTSVVSRGFCVAHGGGKRCQAPACTKSAQTGGFCWVHGGGKKCGYLGCKKRAQSGGTCISHGTLGTRSFLAAN